MKKERLCLILFSILAVLGFAPMLQEHFDIPHVEPLAGVTYPVEFPTFDYKAFHDGSFQLGLEKYLRYHYGYRPWSVRLFNQYLWDCYEKTYTGGVLTIGKEDWFFEPWFVEDYYHGGTYSEGKDSLTLANDFNNEAFRLYQLQHLLEQNGTLLFVCQAPGKDLIYSEYLPENDAPDRPKILSGRDYCEAKFNELHLNHINMEPWFLQMKDTARFNLFPQKGTHWSNLAAIYATDSILHYIEAKKGIQLNRMVIGEPYVGKVRKPDNDLETLLNLIRPLKRLPLYYADVKVEPREGAVKPRLIVIGDSFYWNVCNQVPLYDLFSDHVYWYYNSTVYFDPEHQSTRELDLAEELLKADVVMLMYNPTQLYKMFNGFPLQALLALCCDEQELLDGKEAAVQHIMSAPEWLESIRQRSEEQDIPFETYIQKEAEYVFNLNPQYYLPSLQDSIPVLRSRR